MVLFDMNSDDEYSDEEAEAGIVSMHTDQAAEAVQSDEQETSALVQGAISHALAVVKKEKSMSEARQGTLQPPRQGRKLDSFGRGG